MAVGTLQGKVFVFDLGEDKKVYSYQAHTTEVISLCLMAEKTILSCTRGSQIYLRSLNLVDITHEIIPVKFL